MQVSPLFLAKKSPPGQVFCAPAGKGFCVWGQSSRVLTALELVVFSSETKSLPWAR